MTAPSLDARARVLADVLAALFEHDRELAGQLNAAQRRLQEANASVAGELADAIHRAFAKYQSVAEQRRQLGADVGEAAVRLIDAMQEAGFTEEQARQADVWALRDGIYKPAPVRSGYTTTGFESTSERRRP
jgi:lipase chaperone LimK